MATTAKLLAHVLHTTRYRYLYTIVDEAVVASEHCWICLRPYYTHDEDEDDLVRPICMPIKLSCGHIVGKYCFDEHRKITDDVELCLLCRQKLDGPASRTILGRHLAWICRTRWFRWHDSKCVWTFRGVEDMIASKSEMKLYNGKMLDFLDILNIIHEEFSRVFLRVMVPMHCSTVPLYMSFLAYKRLGDFSGSSDDFATVLLVKALNRPCGTSCWPPWERFPDVLLLKGLVAGNLTRNVVSDEPHLEIVVGLLLVMLLLYYRITWETHFRNSPRRMLVFLLVGRLTYALLGYWIILGLGTVDIMVYLTVATLVVLNANEEVQRNK